MSQAPTAEDSLRAGNPEEALKRLQDQVRANPSNAKLRVFLFQLLAVLGDWDRALNQLGVAAELDVAALAMGHMYREAVKCELMRAEVFAGRKVPMVFGQPYTWLALLIEALIHEGKGEAEAAKKLRNQAFEEAPACAGTLDGKPFEWIADADMRLGPVLEAVVNGNYYWIPFSRLSRIDIEPPEDLRDAVWMPAHLRFENGGESVALIPTRYVGSETKGDGLLALSRKTDWEEIHPEVFAGLGQRLIATDAGEFALMDIRAIEIVAVPGEAGAAETGAGEAAAE